MSSADRTPPAAAPSDPRGATPREGGDIFNDPTFLRYMKIAVVVMALILILGFIGIIARIFYLSSRTPAQPSSSAATLAAPPPPAALPSPLAERVRLVLPAGAVVRSVALSGNRLAVHFETADGAAPRPGIAVVDLESGRTLSRVDLEPGAGPARP